MVRSNIHSLPAPRRFPGASARPFTRLAQTIVARLAELLYARVWILDNDDAVIASSAPMGLGPDARATDHADPHALPRIPLQLDGQTGTLVVGESLNGETVSPR